MRTIKFSDNWNGKLNCEYFTTVRPADYNYPSSGEVEVKKPDGSKFKAKVIDKRDRRYKNLSGWVSRLDAAMKKKELYKLLKNFYEKKDFWQGTDTKVSVLLLKNLEVDKDAD